MHLGWSSGTSPCPALPTPWSPGSAAVANVNSSNRRELGKVGTLTDSMVLSRELPAAKGRGRHCLRQYPGDSLLSPRSCRSREVNPLLACSAWSVCSAPSQLCTAASLDNILVQRGKLSAFCAVTSPQPLVYCVFDGQELQSFSWFLAWRLPLVPLFWHRLSAQHLTIKHTSAWDFTRFKSVATGSQVCGMKHFLLQAESLSSQSFSVVYNWYCLDHTPKWYSLY